MTDSDNREKCIFEKIVDGEIGCEKILEDDNFLSFYDKYPKAPIHALVIPKKHIKDFNEIDRHMFGLMGEFILNVVDKLGIKESGYKLITNTGKDGGQEIPHFHFHILGGQSNRD